MNKNNDVIFSGYDNGNARNKKWEISTEQLVEKIKNSETLKKKTEAIRHLGAEMKRFEAKINEFQNRKDDDPEKIKVEADLKEVEKKYKDLKSEELPLITIHAYFEQGRRNKDPHTYTGVILADIDHITKEEAYKLLDDVKKRPYVLFANISVSGKGLHIIVCVDVEGGINDENFKDIFKVTTQYVDYDLNIETDKTVGTISRCMFLNYDKNIYYNPEAIPLDMAGALWLEKNSINYLNTNQDMDQQEIFSKYRDAADPHLNWNRGNRHFSLVSLASSSNKAGFDENVVADECVNRYAESDFDEKEIRETISDVYKRYSSEHGIKQKAFTPKTDKRTKGQKDTSTEIDDEFLDEEDILCTPCPDISKAKKYIDDNIYGWVIDTQSGQVIQMAAFLALVAAMGATMKDVKCLLRKAEVVGTNLYFILTGAAASGKSCIEPSRDFFRAYAKEVENKSREEIKQQTQAHKAWEKCNKKCEEEDCGCGAEPVVPPLIDIDLSLNTTASRLITQLVNNGDIPTLLSTSELAANMDMKDAPLSPLLRMGHAGETISYNTQKYGNIKIYNRKLTIIGAGTPEQVVDVVKNKEDGLTSRSFFMCLPDTPYKPLDTDDDFDFDVYEAKKEAFEKRALTFALYASNVKIIFKLTKKSRKLLDNYFIEADKRFAKFASDALYSFLRRLRSGDVIIAQILATSYLYNNSKGSGTYEIPDEIIELVISWNDYLVEQHIRVLNMLPETQIKKDGKEIKYPELLKKLPCDFTCKEAWEIAKTFIDISDRHLRRVINKWEDKKVITKKGKTFHKVDCQE